MEKWHYGLLGGAALITLAAAADATVVTITPANTDVPGLANTLNPVILGIPGIALSAFWTGTALPSSVIPFGDAQIPRSMVVDQITVSLNATATCVTPPVVQLVSSANSSFTTQVIIAVSPQLTVATGIAFNSGQLTAGTVVSSNQYVGFELTNFSGTTASCTVLSFNVNAIAH